MTAFDWTAALAGSWLIAAVLAAPVLGRMIRRADETATPPQPDLECETAFLVKPLRHLPPVPPAVRDPLADQPVEVLAGDALKARFDEVVQWGWVS